MNELEPAKRDQLIALFQEGVGVRKAALIVGCHRDTAMRLRRKWKEAQAIKDAEWAVNTAQALHAIVADLLTKFERPMELSELIEAFDRLGVHHGRPNTRMAVVGALAKRKQKFGDVRSVERGVWAICENTR